MSEKKVYQYTGKDTDVFWDGRLCIHIGECGRAKGDLFVSGRQPWCQPDLSSQIELEDIVKRCPTGALHWQHKSGKSAETPTSENTATVCYNGPIYLQGDLDIEEASESPGLRFRAALCRCGESQNKPFCDNSHEKVKFQDYGAIGEKGPGAKSSGGKLTVKCLKDGPVMLSGNLTLYAASGRKAWQGEKVALCRCGASANKPFCDGKHKEIGFKSE